MAEKTRMTKMKEHKGPGVLIIKNCSFICSIFQVQDIDNLESRVVQ